MRERIESLSIQDHYSTDEIEQIREHEIEHLVWWLRQGYSLSDVTTRSQWYHSRGGALFILDLFGRPRGFREWFSRVLNRVEERERHPRYRGDYAKSLNS